jgi:hypothetical protein
MDKDGYHGYDKTRPDQSPDYERGFIDGMQKQMQSSVDKAVNAMSKREWVGLTDEERKEAWLSREAQTPTTFAKDIEQALKEKNGC